MLFCPGYSRAVRSWKGEIPKGPFSFSTASIQTAHFRDSKTANSSAVTIPFKKMVAHLISYLKFQTICVTFDAFAKTQKMAKQKFIPTRLGGFSGAKAYIRYVEVLKKGRNAVGRTFLRRHDI
jgi:hypothetical protein